MSLYLLQCNGAGCVPAPLSRHIGRASLSRCTPMMDKSETEVCIVKGEEQETFSVDEANNAEEVQARFALSNEPACVFKVKRGKKERVAFGSLEDEKTYHLEDDDKIRNQKVHTQNAACISTAAYKDDPTAYISASSTSHTITTVCAISSNSPQGVVLAVGRVGDRNTLYVSFRGTATWDDVIADAEIAPKSKDAIPGGKFHAGFDKRADTVPVKQILHVAVHEKCETIVTCGHSLGGAVSAITYVNLMIHQSDVKNCLGQDANVFNITFGSPFFANKTVRDVCKRERFDQRMLHYVGHQDVVPGILSLGHTIAQLKKRSESLLTSITGED